MFELPQDVTLTLDPLGTEVQARLVRLTREVAADRIDGQWWNIGGSKAAREAEGDHHWRWRRIIGELRTQRNKEALAVETDDGAIQGAFVYRIDALSQVEPGLGALYGEWIATAPRNRPWLVNPPHLRGVGKVLLLAAVRHSYLLGLGGRVWLTSLPTESTRRFYVNRGFQVIFQNPDATIDYELPTSRAVAWLEEEGYLLMRHNHDDFVPVTGGAALADVYVRSDLDSLRDLKVESELDLHLVRLLKLHPDVQVGFRNQDLATLDDATKRAFVQDLNDLLGIKPLRPRRK